MLLNKIKIYQPYNARSAGAGIVDEVYGPTWAADITNGRSAKSIYDKIESMGYLGPIAYVDDTYGDDATADLGNILKPFKTHAGAMAFIGFPSASYKGVIITMPGTYAINNAFGFPLRNNVDHIIINADFNHTGFAYGTFMVYPSAVTCKVIGIGNVNFNNQTSNTDWAQITPYVGCNIEVYNVNFTGAKQIVGQQGGFPHDIQFKFKNCRLISTDNIINKTAGGNFVQGSLSFEDCYLKGHFSIQNNSKSPSVSYKTKFVRCLLESTAVNTNGEVACLGFYDYGINDAIEHVIDNCKFVCSIGNGQNIDFTVAFAGYGANKRLIIQNSDFINLVAGGWILNDHPTGLFYLRNNWSTYNATGAVVVANSLVGAGLTVDANLPNY